MGVFWINLSLVYFLSFFSRYFGNPFLGDYDEIKPNKLFVILSIVILVLVSGLRSNVGDTVFYMHSYEMNKFTWDLIKEQKDIGFGIFQMILQQVSKDPQVLIFATALFTNVLIVLVLYKYSRMLDLSLYVYITGGLFLFTMNGIRQGLAAAIIFVGTKYLMDENFKKYSLVVLLASTVHQSALILIPMYFLVKFKAWSKATLILIFFSIIVVIGFDHFTAVLFSAIENTQYGVYQNFDGGGANILRVAVYAAPIFVAFIGREKLRNILPNSDVIVNMSILGMVFMIISTQNWIFARFSVYFNLYYLILISWIVKLFREKDQKLAYYIIVICYFIYYFFESVLSLGMVYKSDFINFLFIWLIN